ESRDFQFTKRASFFSFFVLLVVLRESAPGGPSDQFDGIAAYDLKTQNRIQNRLLEIAFGNLLCAFLSRDSRDFQFTKRASFFSFFVLLVVLRESAPSGPS